MTAPDNLRHHGDEVIVFDGKGNYECRGVIVGVHRCEPAHYDVQPNRQESMSKRLCGIPESRLRSVIGPIRAYERGPLPEPKHILDDA